MTSNVSAAASPAAAVALMVSRISSVGTERVHAALAIGRILAENVLADRPSPAADVSAMDGYAVRLSELQQGRNRVVGEVRIGTRPPALEGGVVKIVTGGAIPVGVDAVVKREDVIEGGEWIEVSAVAAAALRAGVNIRRRGENAAAGFVCAQSGRAVTAPVIAAMACFGVESILVRRTVRVGIVVTGDELVSAGVTPGEFQLRDSNGPGVSALLGQCGWAAVSTPRRVGDDLDATIEVLRETMARSDALVLTGGVSMGDRDFVPRALGALGAQVVFHKVPQRPGRPVLGAVMADGRPMLALPGNPVSVMVTARRIAVPVLAAYAGLVAGDVQLSATVANPDERTIELWWHRPVRANRMGEVELLPTMGSGDVPGAAASDGFVEVPPGGCGPGPWPCYGWRI